jgi:hypothetical protein
MKAAHCPGFFIGPTREDNYRGRTSMWEGKVQGQKNRIGVRTREEGEP